jgi:hypothetical protein
MYSSSFVNLRGLFNKILYSVFIYRCDETRETVKIINSLSGFISLLLFVQSQVKSINKIFMNVASRLLKDVSFKFVCKMRGLFNKIFFNAASRLLKDVSFLSVLPEIFST